MCIRDRVSTALPQGSFKRLKEEFPQSPLVHGQVGGHLPDAGRLGREPGRSGGHPCPPGAPEKGGGRFPREERVLREPLAALQKGVPLHVGTGGRQRGCAPGSGQKPLQMPLSAPQIFIPGAGREAARRGEDQARPLCAQQRAFFRCAQTAQTFFHGLAAHGPPPFLPKIQAEAPPAITTL